MKVSVIVPIYNAEKYLIECLESIINQTYKNIEIILINDGSTDNSLNICNRYKKYNFLKIISQPNQGVSCARNKGLKIASGKYIVFVDSDDYIAPNMIEELVKGITKTDIAICEYNELYKDNVIPIKIDNKLTSINQEEAILLTFANAGGYLWNKIFKKDIIEKNNLYFDKDIHMLEDQLFVLKYLSKINKAKIIHKSLYNYRIRKTSAARNTNDDKYNTIIIALQKIAAIFQELKISPMAIKQKVIEYSYKDKNKYIIKNVEEIFKESLSNIYKEIMQSKDISISKKIKIFIFKNFNWLYQIYIKNKNKKYKQYN